MIAPLTLAALLAVASPAQPRVAIETDRGTIVLLLEPRRAPLTVANFLRYVESGTYDGASFYRVVRPAPPGQPQPQIQIIQGGLQRRMETRRLPPIAVEPTTKTGLHNVLGTVAMARTSDPNSARAEFFVNLADDRWLDAERFGDGAGYAVFGRVSAGLDVARAIQRAGGAQIRRMRRLP